MESFASSTDLGTPADIVRTLGKIKPSGTTVLTSIIAIICRLDVLFVRKSATEL